MRRRSRAREDNLCADDGDDSDIRMVEIMRRCSVKGTFHINSGLCPPERETHAQDSWARLIMQEFLDLYGEDMEVAIHGATHAYWNKLSSPLAMLDIMDDHRAQEQATGKIIRGASYPYGGYHVGVVELLRVADMQYCRTTETTGKVAMDRDVDWLRFQTTCAYNDPALMIYAWEGLESLLQLVGGHADIWYATVMEIAEYCIAGKNSSTIWRKHLSAIPAILIFICIHPTKYVVKISTGQTVTLPQ